MIKYVIKNDGTTEPFTAEKLNKWAAYATKYDGSWAAISTAVYRLLPETVSSKDIHSTMTRVCSDIGDLTHSRIAARLEIARLRKNMERYVGVSDRQSFKEIMEAYTAKGLWKKDCLPEYNPVWEEWYTECKAIKKEYWELLQWSDKYSLQIDKSPVETPHVALLASALVLHGDTEWAKEMYLRSVSGKLSLPTPALNGLRNGDFDSISCSLMESGDTTDSILVANHLAARMTAKKAGIGIFHHTRSALDPVREGAIDHLGKHGIFKHVQAAVKIFTQLTRGGSATSTVLAIDPEIESIITWKSQRSAIDIRIDQIDYTFSYNDAFVDAVVSNGDWHLFSLYHAPEVHSAFYGTTDEFNAAVQVALTLGKPHKKIKARDLLKLFLTVRIETGRLYSFNATRVNTHTPYNERVHQSNLCVAPETEILTKNGYIPIHELDGSKVEIWNGEEWSEVDVVKTGVNQELMKVTTNAGHSLECTPYHKFYLFDGYGKPYKEVRATDLKVGDKLCKYSLPVISGTKELKNAYINGFYTGDGCLTPEGQRIYLYGEKIKLKEEFGDRKWYDQPQHNRSYTHYDDLMDKYFVPMSEYTITSRVDWLAGFLDADGCVYRNGTNEQFTGSSNNFEFLQRTQRMLQTLGIDSKIVGAREAGYAKLPLNDGSGEYGEFYCNEVWRILIPSSESQKLLHLGLNTKRLKMEKRTVQRDARHFIKIEEIENTGRIDDTYCFSEPKRHMGMFNGILTGQCLEIVQPTAPFRDMEDLVVGDENGDSEGEISFCGLSAANYSQIDINDPEDVRLTIETGIRTVTRMIELAPMLYPPLRKKMLERMNVGFGITGLADAVYKAGLDYDGSDEFYAFVRDLAEQHTFYAYQTSQKMFEEGGRHVPKGINLEWLPVDTAINAIQRPFKMDWESLRGKPRAHSVLVSVQPSESSSVFSGGVNAVYPARQYRIGKQSRAGIVQQIFINFDESKHTSAWDVPSAVMSMMYSCVQDCIDQAISADEFFDPEKYEGGKRPLSEYMKDFVRHARLGNKTQYYINTRIDGSASQINDSATDCEDCKM